MSLDPVSSASGRGPEQPIACRACDLNAICRLTGLLANESTRPRRTGGLRTLRSGAVLFRAGAPAHTLFAIRQGTMKLTHVTTEGDERIVSFHVPGEVLGLEAFAQGTYACDAVALENAQCCELPLPALEGHTPQTAALATQFLRVLGSNTFAVQSPLARGSARERIVNFLLDLSRRLRDRGFDGTRMTPVSYTHLTLPTILRV